jgi:hypothetical protein
VLCTVTQIDAFSNSGDRNAQEFVAMLSRILVFSACLCAVLALPLPTSDACKHCLFIHPFQKDNIAYCQAQNACPVHDDAAVSNVILKVDPATVPFNTSMATLGRFPFLPFFSLLFAFDLTFCFDPKPPFPCSVISNSLDARFFTQLHCYQRNRHWPDRRQDIHTA